MNREESFSLNNSFEARGRPAFIKGMLSPVSIDSFTIALPVKRIKSQGRALPYGTSTTSPGSSSELSTFSIDLSCFRRPI